MSTRTRKLKQNLWSRRSWIQNNLQFCGENSLIYRCRMLFKNVTTVFHRKKSVRVRNRIGPQNLKISNFFMFSTPCKPTKTNHLLISFFANLSAKFLRKKGKELRKEHVWGSKQTLLFGFENKFWIVSQIKRYEET